MTIPSLYDSDFYAWTQEQSARLRAGYFSELDSANIAEELESLGKSQKKELVSRLSVLLAHLLKWQYQADKRTPGWRLTIEEQRDKIVEHLQENPSLKAKIPASIDSAYRSAMRWAQEETMLPKETFPPACPYTWAQMIDEGFYP